MLHMLEENEVGSNAYLAGVNPDAHLSRQVFQDVGDVQVCLGRSPLQHGISWLSSLKTSIGRPLHRFVLIPMTLKFYFQRFLQLLTEKVDLDIFMHKMLVHYVPCQIIFILRFRNEE